MLRNGLYQFPGGGQLGVWEQTFRLRLNENFDNCVTSAKGGPGIKVERQNGELLISIDDLEPPGGEDSSTAYPPPMFPVHVQKDGGADGGSASVATWTYTIRNFYTYATLTTVGTQTKPRPYGRMTYQPGSTGVGVAFFGTAGQTLLWDAGEVETIRICGTST